MKNSLLPGLVLLISACSTVTSYQSETDSEGYSEIKISETSYKVSFKGNPDTSQQRVFDFALLRAAELARKKGYRYIVVRKSESFVTSQNVNYAQPIQTFIPEQPIYMPITTSHTKISSNVCEMVGPNGNVTRMEMSPTINATMYNQHALSTGASYIETTAQWTTVNLPVSTVNSSYRTYSHQTNIVIEFLNENTNKKISITEARNIINDISMKYKITL